MKMRHRKKVSIVIPTFNRCKLLDLTLSSIVSQDVDRSVFEVIVVVDGSSHQTEQVVESYSDVLDIRYFFQEDDGYRVASAGNMGLRNAVGDIIIFIDSGVILGSRSVSSHLQSHASADNVAVIGYILCLQLDDTQLRLFDGYNLRDPDDVI